MSLFVADGNDHGVRGIHALRLDVKRLSPDYDRERPRPRESFDSRLVAIVNQRGDGSVVVHVAADVEVDRQRLAPLGQSFARTGLVRDEDVDDDLRVLREFVEMIGEGFPSTRVDSALMAVGRLESSLEVGS